MATSAVNDAPTTATLSTRSVSRAVKPAYVVGLGDYFDHTALKPDTTVQQIDQLCAEAVQYNFASVCVNSVHVPRAVQYFNNTHKQPRTTVADLRAKAKAAVKSPTDASSSSAKAGAPATEQQSSQHVMMPLPEPADIRVCAVVGFPLGAMATAAKAFEASWCIDQGANEIDMVVQVGLVKSKCYDKVFDDIAAVVDVCHNNNGGRYVVCKVILETCLLTDEEIQMVSHLAGKAGADYIKTSTGFSTGGADSRVVHLMSVIASQYPRDETLAGQPTMRVKASGGVRDGPTALRMLQAGMGQPAVPGTTPVPSVTSRLGTSASVSVLRDWEDSMHIKDVAALRAHKRLEAHAHHHVHKAY